MALFGNLFEKKECAICGGEIGLLGNRKLEDGNLCKQCAAKLSPWFDERRHSTVEQIREQLAYREANALEVASFRAEHSFGENYRLCIDASQGKFMVARTNDWAKENPDIISTTAVKSCELDTQEHRTEETMRDKDGKQVSYNPRRYRYSYDFYMIIRVDHPYFDTMRFKLNNRTIESVPTMSTGYSRGSLLGSSMSYGNRSIYEARQYEDMVNEARNILMSRRGAAQQYAAGGASQQYAAGGAAAFGGMTQQAPGSMTYDQAPNIPTPNVPKSMTCPWCGSTLEGSPKFCVNCGGKLD